MATSNPQKGYTCILLAALFWGLSATWAKHIKDSGIAGTLLISQSRSVFAWLGIFIFLLVRRPAAFNVPPKDIGRFFLLGTFGMAGANFFFYYAIGPMDAAIADMIQLSAPAMVCLYLAAVGREPLDQRKIVALSLALSGCGLALGVLNANWAAPLLAALSAALSAVCFAALTIYGKTITHRYPVSTYLHYALLGAMIVYFLLSPPWKYFAQLSPQTTLLLMAFAAISVLIPYTLFFTGLKQVPASRASIVSTFEPVVVALAGYFLLGDTLTFTQVLGIGLVVGAIIIIETSPPSPQDPTELV